MIHPAPTLDADIAPDGAAVFVVWIKRAFGRIFCVAQDCITDQKRSGPYAMPAQRKEPFGLCPVLEVAECPPEFATLAFDITVKANARSEFSVALFLQQRS